VIDRALKVLHLLEKGSNRRNLLDDLPLFSVAQGPPATAAAPAREIAEILAQVTPVVLSPRQALDLLYELKRLARDCA
jgi:DNA mismatch repair protein MutS